MSVCVRVKNSIFVVDVVGKIIIIIGLYAFYTNALCEIMTFRDFG